MMNQERIIDSMGFIIAGFILFISWILFYNENKVLVGSFFAALMAAGLFWVTYIILRVAWLAFKK